ncbi:hypothetical protein B0H12DRAFT_1080627 [Mycena haematopus]|nr:hypothetical protein B0H12DRAFT_1080627 [Mycena haematopus]
MSSLLATQIALKEMRRRYEDQCAAWREAERKSAYLESAVQQLKADCDLRSASLQQSDARVAEVDEAAKTVRCFSPNVVRLNPLFVGSSIQSVIGIEKELVSTRENLAERNGHLRTAVAEISDLKITLQNMNGTLVESQSKFEKLGDEIQTMRMRPER